MEKLIREFLSKAWDPKHTKKLNFSAVPKGQKGDLAINFFPLLKSPPDKGDLGGLTEVPKSPLEWSEYFSKILEDCDFLEKTEPSGPYLNLFFKSEKFFQTALQTPLESKILATKKIILEYSGPNTNKPLHLGHMRNHALGISVSNTLEAAGAKVHRVNIINDKGLALAKCMLSYKEFSNGETPETTGEKPDHFVGRYYVRYEEAFKKNTALETQLPEIMRAWEAGDKEWVDIWKQLTNWVLAGIQKTYDRQGVTFQLATRESEIYEYGKNLAHKGVESGAFKQKEDGAIIIDLEDKNLGEKAVLRADGTAIYLTQDLSLWPIRKEKFGDDIDTMIYVVGDEQNYYFKTVFESIKKLGMVGKTDFTHLGYGLVNLPDGRMKSREGTVVDADNLMDDLKSIAVEKIKKNNTSDSLSSKGEKKRVWTQQEIDQTAEQIQNAAWKFYLLKTAPIKSITFDKEKSIDFHGATGPYLQYAGVRIKSILRKSLKKEDLESSSLPKSSLKLSPLGDPEKPLGVKIMEWPGVLERAAENKNPTYIVTYLLELAQAWSSFYAENSVLNAETETLKNARVALAQKVLEVLEKGLQILGIEIPERM